jgi:hypothetical protein
MKLNMFCLRQCTKIVLFNIYYFWKYFCSTLHEYSYLLKLEILRLDIKFYHHEWTLSIKNDFHTPPHPQYDYKQLDYNVLTTSIWGMDNEHPHFFLLPSMCISKILDRQTYFFCWCIVNMH